MNRQIKHIGILVLDIWMIDNGKKQLLFSRNILKIKKIFKEKMKLRPMMITSKLKNI